MKKILLSLGILSSLFLTSCYTWWQDTIQMNTEASPASLGTLLYKPEEITSLKKTSQVIASDGLYNNCIKLYWTEVQHAASYRIERAVVKPDSNGGYRIPEEADFEVLVKYITANTYSDTILTNPGSGNDEYSYKFYYRICAENIGKGYESSDYTDITADFTNACGKLLCPPSNVDAEKGKSENSIKITWSAVKNARYYVIYRSEKEKTGYEKIASVKGNQTSYVDEISKQYQGTEYYYKVCAQLSNMNLSAQSIYALGFSLKEGAPIPPGNVRVENGDGKSTSSITIRWDNDVPVSSGKVLTYSVFRSSSVDSSFTQIFSNLSADTTRIEDTKGLKPGIFYYYYVQSVITTGDEVLKSPFSETGPDSQSAATGFLLSPPINYEICDSENSSTVLIRWTPAIGNEAPFCNEYKYNIYYDNEQTGTFTNCIVENIIPSLGADGYYEYEITKYPYYKISTVNTENTESVKSSVFAPLPDAPRNVNATKNSGLGGIQNYTANANGVYPVIISWDAPVSDVPAGYHIYRSTKPDSSFRKLTEEPVSGTTFTFTDENETARAGTAYYYKVVSVNSLGQGKKSNIPSTEPGENAKGYGCLTREQWFREYNKTVKNSQSKLTLMHKPNDMDKLGSETVYGTISGSLNYNASIAGFGASITMHYENYSDYYIDNNEAYGPYFLITGNTDTSANMNGNGNMSGTANCTGMYPGYAKYNNLVIKGGAAGGGSYGVQTKDLDGNIIFTEGQVNWLVGEE